jgi:transcriptional regulator with XRE-family HTH domain
MGVAMTIETEYHKGLVELLVTERKKAGMTQEGLAKSLKQHQSWVSRLESGERRVDVAEFITLARAIGFNPVTALRKVVEGVDA